MLRLFTYRKMRGLNTVVKDAHGKTSLIFFSERVPPPDAELWRAFDDLLSSCEEQDEIIKNSTEEEEEFVDAVESLEYEAVDESLPEKVKECCCGEQDQKDALLQGNPLAENPPHGFDISSKKGWGGSQGTQAVKV